jgi:hypothetical protein
MITLSLHSKVNGVCRDRKYHSVAFARQRELWMYAFTHFLLFFIFFFFFFFFFFYLDGLCPFGQFAFRINLRLDLTNT